MMADDNDWFASKKFGYGAGLPIAWQGWAVMAGYLTVVAACALGLMPRHPLVTAAILTVATLALIVISAQHTRGGWHWRWGGDE